MPVIGSPFLFNHPLYRQLWFHMQRSWGGTRGKGRVRRGRWGEKLLVRRHGGAASDPLSVCKCDLTVHGEYSRLGVCVCVDLTHLWVGQIHRPGEDDPLHYLAAGWRGQRAGVSVIAVHRRWQQIPQDEWPEVGLLFCVEHGINTCQYAEMKSTFFCAGTTTPYLSLFNALLKTLHILSYTDANIYKVVSFHSPCGTLTAFLKPPLVEWWWRQSKASPLVITLARSLCWDGLREEQRERSQIKWPALTADLWLGGSLLYSV